MNSKVKRARVEAKFFNKTHQSDVGDKQRKNPDGFTCVKHHVTKPSFNYSLFLGFF